MSFRNDNDVFAHMNNPVYGVLIDSIVNDYLINHCAYLVTKADQAAIIANTYCDYFGSVSYPDIVECGMRVVKLGKSSVVWEVGIFRKGDENVKAVGGSTHVFVDQKGGVLGRANKEGMPAATREGLSKMLDPSETKGASKL